MNAALAGVMPVASFARFKSRITVFSDERTSLSPFGRCDLVAMVEMQGIYERVVWRKGSGGEPGP